MRRSKRLEREGDNEANNNGYKPPPVDQRLGLSLLERVDVGVFHAMLTYLEVPDCVSLCKASKMINYRVTNWSLWKQQRLRVRSAAD